MRFITSEKKVKIKEVLRALQKVSLTLRDLARILGLLYSSIQDIFPGPLHYWALQRVKADALR